MKMKTIALCVLFVSCIGSCLAVDCYSCVGCGDPFDPAGVSTESCPIGEICMAQNIAVNGTERYSRGCSYSCTPGCIISPAHGSKCSYCCDEDLCNSKSIADEVADILQCYYCRYSSDPSAANFSTPACGDSFDPSCDGVIQFPCSDGECGVITTNVMGVTTVNRMCFSPEIANCTPGCHGDAQNITCQTCCSDNLCNGGTPLTTEMPNAAPSTTELPNAAPPMTALAKASLAAILLCSVGLLVALG